MLRYLALKWTGHPSEAPIRLCVILWNIFCCTSQWHHITPRSERDNQRSVVSGSDGAIVKSEGEMQSPVPRHRDNSLQTWTMKVQGKPKTNPKCKNLNGFESPINRSANKVKIGFPASTITVTGSDTEFWISQSSELLLVSRNWYFAYFCHPTKEQSVFLFSDLICISEAGIINSMPVCSIFLGGRGAESPVLVK